MVGTDAVIQHQGRRAHAPPREVMDELYGASARNANASLEAYRRSGSAAPARSRDNDLDDAISF